MNAVKMLHARIELLKSYLTNLPPSYLNTPPITDSSSDLHKPQHGQINHQVLRSIQALLHRLPLLVPADQATFERDRLAERSDVSLVDLLGHISKNVRDTKEVGRKFGVLQQAQVTRRGPSIMNDDFLMGSQKAEMLSQW
jgi:COP9 signalosome complex subunit 6